LLLSLLAAGTAAAVEDPSGYWTIIDDDGKTATATVALSVRGGQLVGGIVELINPREKDPRCKSCTGERRNRPILGMQILWGLTKDDDEWSGGHILDPNDGSVYKCYLKLIDGGKRLQVRGYLGIALFGRTQYWLRAQPPKAAPKPEQSDRGSKS
jgi:uncharacterized protein (DUF2147 family)